METRPKMDPGCVSQLQGVLPEEYALRGKITRKQIAVSRRESVHSGPTTPSKAKSPLASDQSGWSRTSRWVLAPIHTQDELRCVCVISTRLGLFAGPRLKVPLRKRHRN